ncbi:MAG: hypothetical protein M3R17_08525 [Bacteroidota bacterium]|nr:hypothetical protein [Bacteroidota bacterium]
MKVKSSLPIEKNIMKLCFFYFSIICFGLSLTTNILSILDFHVAAHIPFVWGLHIGAILSFIPVIHQLRKNDVIQKQNQQPSNRKKVVFKLYNTAVMNCPEWMKIALKIILAYVIFNFILFMALQDTKEIETTGSSLRPNVLRGFSGHWMFFYAVAIAVLYPFRIDDSENKSRS